MASEISRSSSNSGSELSATAIEKVGKTEEFGNSGRESCCTPAKYVYISSAISVVLTVAAMSLAIYNFENGGFYPPSSINVCSSFDFPSTCTSSIPAFIQPNVVVSYPLGQNMFWVFNAVAIVAVGVQIFSLIKTGLNQRGHSCKYLRGQWVCSILSASVALSCGIITLVYASEGLIGDTCRGASISPTSSIQQCRPCTIFNKGSGPYPSGTQRIDVSSNSFSTYPCTYYG